MIVARAADFQASWYFSLILLVILVVILVGAGFVLSAVRRMWREGERAPAAIIGAATVFSVLALVGMYATALGAVIITHGSGT